ncbi:hypothetical protein [Caulobacter sp. HMWF009]|uniref:hypothetical protein n=1 Tax=Caulobacter sp. HMWF009 TaxID=2056846 RepID=UPI001E59A5AA|nr:hypothetical protein [Caulobacter sp. HMWF009]
MPKSVFNRAVLAIFLAVVAGWFWYVRSHAPDAASINGTYANPCCNDITIRDGVIYSDNSQTPFKLENMKFGLTVFPSETLQVDGGHVQARPASDQMLLVKEDGRAITICGDQLCRKSYMFERR